MADDTSYSTFLAKANEDPTSGQGHSTASYNESTSQARSGYDPSTSKAGVPKALQDLPPVTFISDTDSDFEPVFFSYASDSLPTLDEFKKVLHAKSGSGEHGKKGDVVTEMSVDEFDPRGQYTEIVARVEQVGREVGEGNRGNIGEGGKGVKVFRVELDRTRVEYYILTVGERKLVGVVAKAVES